MHDLSLPAELLSRVAHLPVDLDRRGTVDVVNPATEKTLTTMTVAGPDTVDAAVTSARQASAGWAETGPVGRRVALRTLAGRLRDHAEALATMITLEHGRPFTDARGEAYGAADLVETYAELAVAHHTAVQGSASGELVFHRSEPWGVVGCVTPWNYPLMAVLNLVAPALAAGNTVVLKPSEKTPASAVLLVEWCTDHLPPGVLNLVLGTGETGSALVRHPGVDLVALTGGVDTGRRVSELAGERLKKTILELGGKDAMIVDNTVDVRVAARMAAQAAFDNSGQICTSIERIYVHEAIKDDFVAQLANEAAASDIVVRADAGDAPTTGDALLLERLVHNLVENAIRHNQPGGWVEVGTRTGERGEAGSGATGCAEVEVVNSGADVPAYEVEGLFKPFHRLRDDRLVGAKGAGLGLSIVRSVAEAHGGSVQARAREGGGLVVKVTLPVDPG
jgi:acyl-CoA reductase-like NAD-dependent aldehyde dehydrogenase